MSGSKRFRQGQILKLVATEQIASQEDLRRRLSHFRFRVNQATLSRDLRELKLVKTDQGYKQLAAEEKPAPPFAQVLREFLTEMRPAQNLLVLKTPPGGAQPIAAAIDREGWKEIAGTIAGDDTILLILPSNKVRMAVQKRIEDVLK